MVGFFVALQYEVCTAFSMPEHRIGGLPIHNNTFSFRSSTIGMGIGGPPIPSLEFFEGYFDWNN